jgi:hypothetical protein
VGSVLLNLAPLIVASALAPAFVIIALLLLSGMGGLGTALAFAVGVVAVRLAQGVIFGLLLGASHYADDGDEQGAIVSILLLVIGVLLWVAAISKLVKADDPDATPPKWMTVFDSVSPIKALGLGALLVVIVPKQWVFMLGAISTIGQGGLSRWEGIGAYLIYVLGASALMLAPIVVRIVAPGRSPALLDAAQTWLQRNSGAIVIAVSAIFGTYFVWKGISALAG